MIEKIVIPAIINKVKQPFIGFGLFA